MSQTLSERRQARMLQSTLLITFDGGPSTVLTKRSFVELFCGVSVNGLAQKEEVGKGHQIRQMTKPDKKRVEPVVLKTNQNCVGSRGSFSSLFIMMIYLFSFFVFGFKGIKRNCGHQELISSGTSM